MANRTPGMPGSTPGIIAGIPGYGYRVRSKGIAGFYQESGMWLHEVRERR